MSRLPQAYYFVIIKKLTSLVDIWYQDIKTPIEQTFASILFRDYKKANFVSCRSC